MSILLTISDFIIPVTILFIVVFGCLQKVEIYEVFLEGAKEGLQTVIDILPTLIGLILAVEVMRAGDFWQYWLNCCGLLRMSLVSLRNWHR